MLDDILDELAEARATKDALLTQSYLRNQARL
jgi:hypothetical protein